MGIFFGLLGLILGSFGNVLVHRLPQQQGIGGRSMCPACGRTLRAWELIPVLSYAWLRGKCFGCRNSIPLRYPLVELSTALLFVFSLTLEPRPVAALGLAGALWLLLLIAVVDLRTMGIPDALNVPFIAAGLIATLLRGDGVDWIAPLLGAGFFGAQWLLSRGAWVGSGDILLAIGIGFLLADWRLMLLCLLLAYVAGACVAAALLLSGRVKKGDYIPFGPFLALGALLTVAWGEWMMGMMAGY